MFDGVFHGLDSQMSEEWVGCAVSMDCCVFSQTVFNGVFHGLDPQMSEEWVAVWCLLTVVCSESDSV